MYNVCSMAIVCIKYGDTMTKKLENPGKRGRKTLYRPEMIDIALDYCSKGATQYELACRLGIGLTTLLEWISSKPDFADAIKRGNLVANQNVVKSLYKRATGYAHESTKVFLDKEGNPVKVPYTERFAPDPTSMIFWLKNRRPDRWRDKQDIQVETGPLEIRVTHETEGI